MAGPPLARMAWRNLWRNRRRTVLTLASIAFGFLLAVLFTSLQDRNFADMIDYAARLGGGHVTLQHPEYLDTPTLTRTVDDASGLVATAEADPGVRRAVPRILGQAMVDSANGSGGGFLIAYDPELEDGDTLQLIEGLVDGEWPTRDDVRQVVLGKKLAENLEVGLGDKVVYTVMDKEGQIAAGVARVKGLVGTGAPSMDAALVMMPLDTLRDTVGYGPDEATRVAVFLQDPRRTPTVRDRLAPQMPEGATALTWDEVAPDLNAFIAMKVGGAMFMELIIMVLVAASIFNTLFVSVLERMREFGVLLAIGWSPFQIFRLVVWESIWLGLVGLVTGSVITAPLYAWLVTHPIDLSGMLAETDSLEVAGVGMPTTLNIGIFPDHFAMIAVFIVLATVAAGLWPAWKAGRIEPVDAIRLV